MIRKTITVAGLLAICLLTLSASPQSKPQQWEYKFDYKCNEKRANDLASQGWELIQLSSSPISGGSMAIEICVFKRPKV